MAKSQGKNSKKRGIFKKTLSGVLISTPLVSHISAQTVWASGEDENAQTKKDDIGFLLRLLSAAKDRISKIYDLIVSLYNKVTGKEIVHKAFFYREGDVLIVERLVGNKKGIEELLKKKKEKINGEKMEENKDGNKQKNQNDNGQNNIEGLLEPEVPVEDENKSNEEKVNENENGDNQGNQSNNAQNNIKGLLGQEVPVKDENKYYEEVVKKIEDEGKAIQNNILLSVKEAEDAGLEKNEEQKVYKKENKEEVEENENEDNQDDDNQKNVENLLEQKVLFEDENKKDEEVAEEEIKNEDGNDLKDIPVMLALEEKAEENKNWFRLHYARGSKVLNLPDTPEGDFGLAVNIFFLNGDRYGSSAYSPVLDKNHQKEVDQLNRAEEIIENAKAKRDGKDIVEKVDANYEERETEIVEAGIKDVGGELFEYHFLGDLMEKSRRAYTLLKKAIDQEKISKKEIAENVMAYFMLRKDVYDLLDKLKYLLKNKQSDFIKKLEGLVDDLFSYKGGLKFSEKKDLVKDILKYFYDIKARADSWSYGKDFEKNQNNIPEPAIIKKADNNNVLEKNNRLNSKKEASGVVYVELQTKGEESN